MKDLLCLTGSELRAFLDSFDDILCDLDGVVWMLGKTIMGVENTFSKMRQCGKRIRFVTNNSTGGVRDLHKRLNRIECEIQLDDIACPSLAIIDYLKKNNFEKELFIVGTEVMKREFTNEGFIVAHSGPASIEEDYGELVKNMADNSAIGAVVFDFDINLNYIKLLRSLTYLRRPDVQFLAGATDRTIPIGRDIFLIGQGFFQNTLKELTGRNPTYFGKPAANFNKYIVEKFNIKNPSRTLVIGDSLEQDMKFASKFGYQKLLTLTGSTSLEEVKQIADTDMVPHYYINSLGNIGGFITEKLNI